MCMLTVILTKPHIASGKIFCRSMLQSNIAGVEKALIGVILILQRPYTEKGVKNKEQVKVMNRADSILSCHDENSVSKAEEHNEPKIHWVKSWTERLRHGFEKSFDRLEG